MKKAIISLENVWKIYQMGKVEVSALRGLNLQINEGEFLAIQGPSGSGKSTCMNLIGCLDLPSKGNIFLDGHNILHLSENELANIRGRKIGFVFQQFNLIRTLSAMENVMLPMVFQGIEKASRKRRASELLNLMGLEKRTGHLPAELSGGEQQRVAIARALANNPEVILADEPTGNLDSKTGEHIMNLLKQLHEKEGKTVVIITHDEHLAKMARRTEYIKDGQIVRSIK